MRDGLTMGVHQIARRNAKIWRAVRKTMMSDATLRGPLDAIAIILLAIYTGSIILLAIYTGTYLRTLTMKALICLNTCCDSTTRMMFASQGA
jgi:hypothetical protein